MNLPSAIQQIHEDLFLDNNISVFLKRDDLIHPEISGNKWRKLKFNIQKFNQGGYDKILTFGGAYSNHIAASAAVSGKERVPFIGLIRGDELNINSNKTLQNASANGMELAFISREEYSLRDEKYYQEELRRRYGNILIVPEGGKNFHGMLGCSEIISEMNFTPDYIFCPAGTGTTAAGVLTALGHSKLIAVSALKGGSFLKEDIAQLLKEVGWIKEDIEEQIQLLTLEDSFHFGGYAKYDETLIEFINGFYKKHLIKLDQVYTGKMMFALYEYIKSGKIKENSTIMALHTGGIQGTKSIPNLFV